MTEYGTTWETCHTIKLGGGWAFAVGIIRDARGGRKVRVAKGKIKAEAEAGECPVSQVNKLNLKPKDWAAIRDAIDEAIGELEEIEEGS